MHSESAIKHMNYPSIIYIAKHIALASYSMLRMKQHLPGHPWWRQSKSIQTAPNNMSFKRFVYTKTVLLLLLSAGYSLSAQVDTVFLNFKPVNGGATVSTFAFNGTYGFMADGPIQLLESTNYQLEVQLGSADAELRSRKEEIQFFFELISDELLINEVKYDDEDSNGLPVGFRSSLRTECKDEQVSGQFKLFLKDLKSNKTDSSTVFDGTTLLAVSWGIRVNNDPDAPPCVNEEEIITDIILTFTPESNNAPVSVARIQDPDGEGPLGLIVLDNIQLLNGVTYQMEIQLLNEITGDDITEEIRDEEDEHLFFFAWTEGLFSDPPGDGNIDERSNAVNYLDFDKNGLPLGLKTRWTVAPTPPASRFRLVLKHQPDGQKTGLSASEVGGTDLDLSWPVEFLVVSTQEQQELNQQLQVMPNPAQEQLNWKIEDSPSPEGIVQILDLQGRLQIQQACSTQQSIDLSSLAAGIYILQVFDGQYTRIARFVKH